MLQQQHIGIATTYEIRLSLQEMFGDNDRLVRQATIRTIMNIKMIERTSVGDHMICMIVLFNKMKILGLAIDEES